MNRRGVYFVWTILGAIGPLSAFGVFLANYGFDVGEFFGQLLASPIATMILVDVTLSSFIFWVWMIPQARKHGIPGTWIVVANLAVGLSFALPLFLYLRERRQEQLNGGRISSTAIPVE